jgi:hypothetical protein
MNAAAKVRIARGAIIQTRRNQRANDLASTGR